MPLATKLSTVCDALVALLEAQAETLGIAEGGVFYGDQARLPVSPAVCVEPGLKSATMYGAGRMTELTLTVTVLVYHSEIKSIASNRRDADTLAEAVASLIVKSPTFNGLVIHCMVREVESGYSVKDRTTMRSTRLQWTATSQERLPNEGEV